MPSSFLGQSQSQYVLVVFLRCAEQTTKAERKHVEQNDCSKVYWNVTNLRLKFDSITIEPEI